MGKEESEREIDWNDAEHNPTTVAYNTVNITYQQQQQDEDGGLEADNGSCSSSSAVKRAASLNNDDPATTGEAGADKKRIKKK